MAKVVDEMPFSRGPNGDRYKWDDWTDGRIWKLTQGVDFEVSPESFRKSAAQLARRTGYKLLSKIRMRDLYLQFVAP